MNCEEARILVHALADGELDAGHAREVEAHVAQCDGCAAELAAAREMTQALRAVPLGFAVPASLSAKIDRVVPTPMPVTNRRALLKGFAFGGVASALAAASVGLVVFREGQDDRILGEAISAHLRSLQADHLTDVLSTNQHTVKPWFNGRIDLAPPVIDLTAQGFTLIGGRLDYIDGKPAAALVYRRRIHVINLFVAQGLGEASSTPKLTMMQGFNLLRWNENGLNMLAVSDLNRDELEEFGAKFSAAARTAAQS
ncbi:MAG TPA: anti-sigma factor [Pseudolabrys sp.]|jgi:anti-sigma factor RsiW|nr:anti-sigma factor [Pseudolabrys sp.]HEX2536722.1 anti-sigma factor [Pseudolabrys sp.]